MLYDYNSKDDICLTHLKSFSLNPSFNIINCIDKSSDKILMAKKKYGTTINYFNSFSSDIPKTDIYVLCALSNDNRNFFNQILKLSKNPFFLIEKPAWKNKINHEKSFINYFRKCLPKIKKIKSQFDLGAFGSIQTINCYYTKGLKNNGSHLIDLIFYFFGCDIKKESIVIYNSFNDFHLLDKTISFSFKLNHKKNLISVNFTGLNENMFSIIEIDIITQSNRIKITDFGEKIEYFSIAEDPIFPNYKILKKVKTQYSNMYKAGFFTTKELYKILNNSAINNSDFENENQIQNLLEIVNKKLK
jgi:hypothetical protein